MAQDSASRKLDQYIVRFPDGMRDQLKSAAAESNRSLNAEIVARLEAYDSLHSMLAENAADRQRLEAENIVLKGALEDAVRLPIGLHDRIEEVAEAHERTLSEEVVQALEAAFPPPPTTFGDYMANLREVLAGDEMDESLKPIFRALLIAYETFAKNDPQWVNKVPAHPVKPGSFPGNFTPAED